MSLSKKQCPPKDKLLWFRDSKTRSHIGDVLYKTGHLFNSFDVGGQRLLSGNAPICYAISGENARANGLSCLDQEALNHIANTGGALILDISTEGSPNDNEFYLDIFRQALERGISLNKVIVLHQNLQAPFVVRNCSEKLNQPAPHVIEYNSYIRLMMFHYQQEPLPNRVDLRSSDAKYRFLCLNNAPKWHRELIVIELMNNTTFKESLVSYIGGKSLKSECRDDFLLDRYGEFYFKEKYPELRADLKRLEPVICDLSPVIENKLEMEYRVNFDMYDNSMISIITESEFSDGSLERITEKTIKPLLAGHPFVIVGNPGSLKQIKRLGFKTFSPHINESYDQICNPTERLSCIIQEVRRLSQLTNYELKQLRCSLKDIIDFNLSWSNNEYQSYLQRIDEHLIATISRVMKTR